MWPPPTVWNSTHPQVHVHSLRLSPARLCSVGKISVWLISVQFSQKNKKTKNMKFWLFHSSLNFWSHFFRKKCIFSTNFHFLPNLTQKTQFSTVAQFTTLKKAEKSQPDSTLSSGQRTIFFRKFSIQFPNKILLNIFGNFNHPLSRFPIFSVK